MANPAFNAAMVARTLGLIHPAGSVIEIRMPKSGRFRTVSGYFDDVNVLVKAVTVYAHKAEVPGIYFTLNECRRALFARAANVLKPYADTATSDDDIVRRRALGIDFDPKRPAKISSTEGEHTDALRQAHRCREWLSAMGWPDPIEADSGNGGHLVYGLDLPNDEETRRMLEKILAAIELYHSTPEVLVDTGVFNAARIWKLYGTLARKGSNILERPHRRSAILSAPNTLTPVPLDLLQAVAEMAPTPQVTRPAARGTGTGGHTIDAERWLTKQGIEVQGTKPWKGGTLYQLAVCPWNPDHTDNDARVIQWPNGALEAGCFHNGCRGKDWHALRELFEPGWQARRNGPGLRTPHQANPTPQHETFVSSVSAASMATEDWPAPQPLPDLLLPVEPFEPKLLPEAFRPWIEDIAERMQCPPDYPAVAAMVGHAAVVGRRVGIRPKHHDDWLVVPNLWGGAIGRPGVLKTPAIQEPLRPLWRLEYDAGRAHEEARHAWMARQLVSREREKVASGKIRDALKRGHDATILAEQLLASEESEPVRQRYIVNDSTVEKLGELLNENPNGLLVFRDELTGFLRTLDREGHEAARAFYLEAWNGSGRFTYDRTVRGTIEIEAACTSILGGIQPGPLGHYLRASLEGGMGDDGLIQRFQLLVWPDVSKEWRNVDRWPDSAAKRHAYDVFTRMSQLTSDDVGAECDEELDGIPYLRFDADAQELFTEWRSDLEHRLRRNEDHPAIEAHLAKYRSLIPSLALLIHLAEGGRNPIGTPALERACAWAEHLESQARRVYSRGIAPDDAAARALASKLLKHELPHPFTLRDVYRSQWTALTTREEAAKAVEALIDLHWLRAIRVETGGRPSEDYLVNPRIWEAGHEVA